MSKIIYGTPIGGSGGGNNGGNAQTDWEQIENNVVMYSTPQTLTDEQQKQACQNIGIPVVTTADAGKFVRVSSEGKWIVETIPNAEEVAF